VRKTLLLCSTLCLALGLAGPVSAQDDCRPIIEKAIKATGGPEKLAKLKATQSKSKGTLEVMGMTLEMTIEATIELPGRMKSVMDFDVMGIKINAVQVFNKDKAWIVVNANGVSQSVPVEDKLLNVFKEADHQQAIGTLVPLLNDKMYTLSPLGEIKIGERTAVGVKVAAKEHKDVNLFFDKDTGLLSRVEGPSVNSQMEEVSQESTFSEYKEFDGLKRPTKVQVKQDGKKVMDAEVLEIKFVDKFDDSEFAKP
jgi:hypothetical protein